MRLEFAGTPRCPACDDIPQIDATGLSSCSGDCALTLTPQQLARAGSNPLALHSALRNDHPTVVDFDDAYLEHLAWWAADQQ